MRRLLLTFVLAMPLAGAGACSLNPQPLPPGDTPDAASPTTGGSGGGSGSSGGSGNTAGGSSGSSSGGQTLAGDAGASFDATAGDSGVVNPPVDGGGDGPSGDGAGPTGDGALSD